MLKYLSMNEMQYKFNLNNLYLKTRFLLFLLNSPATWNDKKANQVIQDSIRKFLINSAIEQNLLKNSSTFIIYF